MKSFDSYVAQIETLEQSRTRDLDAVESIQTRYKAQIEIMKKEY